MSRRTVRDFRKEMLLLQAEQYRLALRQDLASLAPMAPEGKDHLVWIETLAGILGAVLPARWGRWLNVALSAWRIGRQALMKNS
ncbi:MAG: hypothetical protein H6R19_1249 [Proteobacteria bacterium]|nr:hypothetical protein [Pseudomonadota bacterium]